MQSLALDALEMAIWTRHEQGANLSGLVHHSDRGSQYRAVRYPERLADAGAVASVGSRGDSYHNSMAESVNGLFKTELYRPRGPWRGLNDLELAATDYIDWFHPAARRSALRGGESVGAATGSLTAVVGDAELPGQFHQ